MDSLEAQWKKFSLSEVEGDTADLVSTIDSPKKFSGSQVFHPQSPESGSGGLYVYAIMEDRSWLHYTRHE